MSSLLEHFDDLILVFWENLAKSICSLEEICDLCSTHSSSEKTF